MDQVRLSDDERLITLTKSAYEKIESEILELRMWLASRTVRVIYEVDFNRPDRYRSRYDLDRVNKIDLPMANPDESESDSLLLSRIKEILKETNEVNNTAYRELLAEKDALNKLLDRSQSEVSKNKLEAERIYNSVPKILRWIFKN